MRKLRLFMIPIFASAFILSGCKKNFSEENYTPIVNPVTPDFTTKVNASVKGFITNENGDAVEGANVTGGDRTVTTDGFGYFKITNAAFSKSAGFIRVNKAGYFTGYRAFLPIEGKEIFNRLQLIPKTTTSTIQAVAGGTATTTGGATVTLPANAVVIASGNNPYSGAVNIAAHWLDPSDMPTTSLTMPGDLTGVDSAGHLNVLQSFGMLTVELTGSNGELLQVAPGKKAALHFPLPSSLQGAAPAYIPLWYFDETKGMWIQEGKAIKNGSSYEGEVSHFSYWNCDIGLPLVNFDAQLVDPALRPLSNIPVSVGVTGQVYLSRIAYTDTNGRVSGLVPANSNLSIEVIASCNERLFFKNITTKNTPIDLGTLQVALQEYGADITGTVTKCNGDPVVNGDVFMSGVEGNSIMHINNGVFSASGLICSGANAALIAFDRETSLQSDVRNVTLTAGPNNIEPIQVCTASTTENITIAYGGSVPVVSFMIPQHMFGGNFYFLNDSTSINAIDLLNGSQQVVQFSFTGPAAPGNYPLSRNSFTAAGSSFVFDPPVSVNITAYGLIGQFITGSINGRGSLDGGPAQDCQVIFNIQRDQ